MADTVLNDRLTRTDGATLAYTQVGGQQPGLIFLHGLNSDRGGTKAEALLEYCGERDRAFLSFDMFGHGDSSGDFQDGSISRWTEDAVAVLDELTCGPQILVGSSMGGWVMLRTALQRPERIAGLIGIAAAPDFTEDLMWANFTEEQRSELLAQGHIEQPSDYSDDPYVIAQLLIEDGRRNLLLRDAIPIEAPVRLLHGQKDEDVPWQTALTLGERLAASDVEITLIKDGDHRLSRSQDLRTLCTTVDRLIDDIYVGKNMQPENRAD